MDNANVVSIVQGTSKERTAEIWSSLYPEEPYELNISIPLSEEIAEKFSEATDYIKYDLISAVRRQSSFVYQVVQQFFCAFSFNHACISFFSPAIVVFCNGYK